MFAWGRIRISSPRFSLLRGEVQPRCHHALHSHARTHTRPGELRRPHRRPPRVKWQRVSEGWGLGVSPLPRARPRRAGQWAWARDLPPGGDWTPRLSTPRGGGTLSGSAQQETKTQKTRGCARWARTPSRQVGRRGEAPPPGSGALGAGRPRAAAPADPARGERGAARSLSPSPSFSFQADGA